jgi:hypothetical protein
MSAGQYRAFPHAAQADAPRVNRVRVIRIGNVSLTADLDPS